MDKIVIWGASGHAKVVADILRVAGRHEIVGFLDDVHPQRQGEPFAGSCILGGQEQLPLLRQQGVEWLVFGFGNCDARVRLSGIARGLGFRLATAIHPSAIVSADAVIGSGAIVAAGAVVNPCSVVGENAIINTLASIDHDCQVGEGAHICPGVRLGGRVTIGKRAWVGIGTTVIEGIRIGEGCLVGAGAVVVEDVPDGVVAYGNPARIKRQNK